MVDVFVLHGGGDRDEQEFRDKVGRLNDAVGRDRFTLRAVWYGTVAGADPKLIRGGLPATYPPKPPYPWSEVTRQEAEPTDVEFRPPVVAYLAWHGRRLVLDNFAGLATDLFFYWHSGQVIRDRVAAALGEQSGDLHVVGHSLGGMIAVDLAAQGRLRIRDLITFGSQSSVAHVLDPSRSMLPPYVPNEPNIPIPVPGIRRWINLWNRYDPLAFAASRVFRLETGAVDDRESELPEGTHDPTKAHGSYWESNALVKAIQDISPLQSDKVTENPSLPS